MGASLSISHFPETIYAQSQSAEDSSSGTTPSDGNNMVSVTASITMQVSNETAKVREGVLRSAVVGLFNSGVGILKTSDSTELITKTKITNQINNTTQSVEGIEATNAVIGVEISKALRSVVSLLNNTGQTDTISLDISSACKPAGVKVTSCENSVIIK
jgi:hypothetical protein